MESYGCFAAVYDRLMEDMPYDAWVEFAEQAWRRYMPSKPERIVDLGCGTGNITLPLAARGYALTGIDLSEMMLAVAEQKAASAIAKSGSIRWLCQDMREWNAGEPADAVVSFCDCLNYITEEADVKRVFTATFRQPAPAAFSCSMCIIGASSSRTQTRSHLLMTTTIWHTSGSAIMTRRDGRSSIS